MLSLKKFAYVLIFGTLIVFFVAFYIFFSRQIHATADVIVRDVKKELSSFAYIVSRQIQEDKKIYSFNAELKRISASNEFIETIQLFDGHNMLLTTDPRKNARPSSKSLYIPEKMNSYEILKKKKVLSQKFAYFEGLNKKFLWLYVYFDYDAIKTYIDKLYTQMMLWMTVLALLYFSFLYYIIKRVIIDPSEILRQYAYYQSQVPKKMLLIEYEYIRASMVQTFSRLEKEKKELYRVSRTDRLSGLPNREALHERLEWLIAESERNGNQFALLFMDLDNFKTINDALGHAVGDAYLKEVALIIKEILRSNDTVARIGGDEFVIVVSSYESLTDLTLVIERIQKELQKSRIIETFPIETTCSIGVALFPKDGRSEEALLKQADIAMYQAKSSGKNRYHFFTQELYDEVQREIKRAKEMKQSIVNEDFELYYQPKTEVAHGRIVGCEALIRWNHPKEGLVYPDAFIALAEKEGLIIELGNWIIKEAMQQQVRWQKRGYSLNVAINISVKQLFFEHFIDNFKTLLKETGANPQSIQVEIVESLFLHDTQKSYKLLSELHDLGVSIALDDFGTGYSSLSYLKNYPIDLLKIDKSFIDDYESRSGALFLETIVNMGRNLQMDVLCEGVEQAEQLAFLRQLGCEFYQGYYCSKPVPVEEFEVLLEQECRP